MQQTGRTGRERAVRAAAGEALEREHGAIVQARTDAVAQPDTAAYRTMPSDSSAMSRLQRHDSINVSSESH